VPSVPPLPPDRPDLQQRYGLSGPRWPSYLPLAVVGLVLVGLLAATAWGLVARSTGVRAAVLAYGDITASSITITLEVARDPAQPVVCDVAAVGENQVDVGAALVEVPTGGDERVVVRATIETASSPKAARLLGCRPLDPVGG